VLEKDWWARSSLTAVIFESAGSLQAMMNDNTVDLEGTFDIYVVQWDGVMNFPGYSVSMIRTVDNLVGLIKS
jgi:hypothetical protein